MFNTSLMLRQANCFRCISINIMSNITLSVAWSVEFIAPEIPKYPNLLVCLVYCLIWVQSYHIKTVTILCLNLIYFQYIYCKYIWILYTFCKKKHRFRIIYINSKTFTGSHFLAEQRKLVKISGNLPLTSIAISSASNCFGYFPL